MTMNDFRLLGQTGLRVSPLCLGAMTFGEEWGMGMNAEDSKNILARFLDVGGNFIDTADVYNNGTSEKIIGEFMRERNCRDRCVVATKFSFNVDPSGKGKIGNPNAGGNGRKNIQRAVESSLKRLQTDYIDLLYLHAWDMVTRVEEVLTTMNDLVRQGKVLHVGLSDVPAWYAARAQTIAELRGYEPIACLQLEYSLISRTLEREHLPLCRETNIGIVGWSPLASGILTGKYTLNDDGTASGDGRMNMMHKSKNPVFEKFYAKRPFEIAAAVKDVALEIGRSPAEIAINFVVNQPGISSTIISATKMEQLESNLKALEFNLPETLKQKLLDASAYPRTELDDFWELGIQKGIHGGCRVLR